MLKICFQIPTTLPPLPTKNLPKVIIRLTLKSSTEHSNRLPPTNRFTPVTNQFKQVTKPKVFPTNRFTDQFILVSSQYKPVTSQFNRVTNQSKQVMNQSKPVMNQSKQVTNQFKQVMSQYNQPINLSKQAMHLSNQAIHQFKAVMKLSNLFMSPNKNRMDHQFQVQSLFQQVLVTIR